jgi:DNA replication protein DnaC
MKSESKFKVFGLSQSLLYFQNLRYQSRGKAEFAVWVPFLSVLTQQVSTHSRLFESLGHFSCEQEMQQRERTRNRRGFSLAKFPYIRNLEQFDFSGQPSLDADQIRELETCRWIANGDTLLLLGPSGIGQTHLALLWAMMVFAWDTRFFLFRRPLF